MCMYAHDKWPVLTGRLHGMENRSENEQSLIEVHHLACYKVDCSQMTGVESEPALLKSEMRRK